MAPATDSLFDAYQRTDDSTARYTEPTFDFLNRSSWRSVERMRAVFDEWFDRYPAAAEDSKRERRDLRARYRSRHGRNHHGAFFELFLHELFLRLGCGIDVHPEITGTSVRPDFRVSPPNGDRFYLEATAVTGASEEEEAAAARKAVVHDAINQIETNNFILSMSERGTPATPPRATNIRRVLQRELDSLDPDEVAVLWEQGGDAAVPAWTFKHEGWEITFQPIPKKPEARNRRTKQPIGCVVGEADWVDGASSVRDAVTAKGKHLDALDLPLVVAVNTMDWATERPDVMDALFGKEAVTLRYNRRTGEVLNEESSRQPNGAWTSTGGPRYTRIVAVLVVQMLTSSSVCALQDLRLYHNPYVSKPLYANLTRIAQAVPR